MPVWWDRVKSWLSPDDQRRAAGLDRRAFLRLVASGTVGAAVASTVDVEALLWTPGQSIVVPDLGSQLVTDGWTPHKNTFVTPDWVTKEAVKVLNNNLTFAKTINRQYDEQWMKEQLKPAVDRLAADIDRKLLERVSRELDLSPQFRSVKVRG